jgi:hypothetical protein
MGSSGSGNLSDYQDYEKNKSSQSEQGGNSGGSSGEDQCSRAFSTSLDEVSLCEYYKNKKNVPPVNAVVKIDFKGRLRALVENDVCIGYLPTKYNFLRACMNDGFTYSGVIHESKLTPIPSIAVDIAPDHD